MDNADVIREWFAAVEAGDIKAVDRFYDTDFVAHPAGKTKQSSREAVRTELAAITAAAPNPVLTIKHLLATDDLVFCHYTMDLVDSGKAFNLPATQRRVQINGIDLYRLQDGKIVEQWAYSDEYEEMKRQGDLPR